MTPNVFFNYSTWALIHFCTWKISTSTNISVPPSVVIGGEWVGSTAGVGVGVGAGWLVWMFGCCEREAGADVVWYGLVCFHWMQNSVWDAVCWFS